MNQSYTYWISFNIYIIINYSIGIDHWPHLFIFTTLCTYNNTIRYDVMIVITDILVLLKTLYIDKYNYYSLSKSLLTYQIFILKTSGFNR